MVVLVDWAQQRQCPTKENSLILFCFCQVNKIFQLHRHVYGTMDTAVACEPLLFW